MPRPKTQRGGEPVMEVAPPSTDVMEPRFESYEDTLALSGGAKKGAAKGKKTAAKSKKPAAAKGKKPASKKGGALVDDVKNLAVPFAILLAKQGLEGMFKKKEKKSSSAAVSVRRRSAAGGSCSTCATVPAQAGGAKVNRYKQLSDEIDRFLAKY